MLPSNSLHPEPGEVGCCDRKSPSCMCAKLRTVAASNNRVHMPWSLYYCLFTPHRCIVVLRAHPVMVNHTFKAMPMERLLQHPSFLQWTAQCFVKALHSTTSTSWSQHHFAAIGEARAPCAQSFTLWQQATTEFTCHDHYCCLFAPQTYLVFAHIPFYGESHI